jgi:ABC-type sugar transport system ATPase subunit
VSDNILGGQIAARALAKDRKRMRTEAAQTLRVLDILIDRLDLPLRSMSGGQRQAVAIGRAIHWKAKVLIMDEPTAALGVPEQRKVKALVRSLKQSGVGVIFISLFAVAGLALVSGCTSGGPPNASSAPTASQGASDDSGQF